MELKLWQWMLILVSLLSSLLCQQMKIIFSTKGLVKELDLSTGNVKMLVNVNQSRVFSMAYDYKYGYVFLPRYELGDILRLQYTSDQSLVTVVPAAASPTNVVIDPMYDHLYWTERYSEGRIARCNFDGSNMTIITSEIQPWAIMLELTNRFVYLITALLHPTTKLMIVAKPAITVC